MIPLLDPATHRQPFAGEDRPYRATLSEVHARFVAGAPTPQTRERIWSAFLLWSELAQQEFPGSRYLLSGSFLTDKQRPSDLDVILVLEPGHVAAMTPEPTIGARVLLSHLTVTAAQPSGTTAKLQPMGGLVDGFWCYGWVPAQMAVWQFRWSSVYDKVAGKPTGGRMGYLEVAP